jgi:hypothetical protein
VGQAQATNKLRHASEGPDSSCNCKEDNGIVNGNDLRLSRRDAFILNM